MLQERYLATPVKDEETPLHAIINKGSHGTQKCKRAWARSLSRKDAPMK
jgi:hypothetical protein